MSVYDVRRQIRRIPSDIIFTTRQLLNYSTRAIVDKTLSNLVKSGHIVRLARGVFIRDGSNIPSLYQIAYAKARAFGKEITACAFSNHEEVVPEHYENFAWLLYDPATGKRIRSRLDGPNRHEEKNRGVRESKEDKEGRESMESTKSTKSTKSMRSMDSTRNLKSIENIIASYRSRNNLENIEDAENTEDAGNMSDIEDAGNAGNIGNKQKIENELNKQNEEDYGGGSNKKEHEITFLIAGSTSSFKCGNIIIRFKSACSRKVKLSDDTKATKVAKTLWQMGKENLTWENLSKYRGQLQRTDKQFMSRILTWLPTWLSKHFLSDRSLDNAFRYKYAYEQFYAVDSSTGYIINEKIMPYLA